MFTEFFYLLRKRKVPVSITEWMTFIEALSRGCVTNLDDFYFLARAVLVKSEAYYDHYDVAFQEFFNGIEAPADFSEQLMEWLKNPLRGLRLSDEELARLKKLSLEDLLKELEKRLEEQDSQHDGGSKWIGRGGRSPFGHSGSHPAGIRIGGESMGRHAVKVAQERRFRNYRNDLTLDVRQMKMALRGLRQLTQSGPEDELDLDRTIRKIARNAGEIELVWRRRRKNTVKVLLLMDVGGSMEPFAMLCSQLFSAAHSSTHFKDFQFYYFHNCVYDNLYKDAYRQETIATEYLLHNLAPDYKLLMVGDATMAPYELTEKHGAISYYERNEVPGLVWLKRLADHFSHRVWLNPEDPRAYFYPTVRMISRYFPMYPLTLEGLGEAIKSLTMKRPVMSFELPVSSYEF